jgi:hypothetical protein
VPFSHLSLRFRSHVCSKRGHPPHLLLLLLLLLCLFAVCPRLGLSLDLVRARAKQELAQRSLAHVGPRATPSPRPCNCLLCLPRHCQQLRNRTLALITRSSSCCCFSWRVRVPCLHPRPFTAAAKQAPSWGTAITGTSTTETLAVDASQTRPDGVVPYQTLQRVEVNTTAAMQAVLAQRGHKRIGICIRGHLPACEEAVCQVVGVPCAVLIGHRIEVFTHPLLPLSRRRRRQRQLLLLLSSKLIYSGCRRRLRTKTRQPFKPGSPQPANHLRQHTAEKSRPLY